MGNRFANDDSHIIGGNGNRWECDGAVWHWSKLIIYRTVIVLVDRERGKGREISLLLDRYFRFRIHRHVLPHCRSLHVVAMELFGCEGKGAGVITVHDYVNRYIGIGKKIFHVSELRIIAPRNSLLYFMRCG